MAEQAAALSPIRDDRLFEEHLLDGLRPAQRDHDRILTSTSFRRLAEVTQIISAEHGHVFHNRLTHSLEVAIVARRLAEKLIKKQPDEAKLLGGIDPDVVESAALAHDLGHPPFAMSLNKSSMHWSLLPVYWMGLKGIRNRFGSSLNSLSVPRTIGVLISLEPP